MVKIEFDSPEKTEQEDLLSVRLTLEAANRIEEIITSKKSGIALNLRVSVSGGGCGGYSYGFKLVDTKTADDISISNESKPEITVLIDPLSFSYLKGSTIDFEETIEASQFIIHNPNAKSSCGCGNSFSV